MRVDRAHVTLDASLMVLVPEVSYFKLGSRYFSTANERRLGAATWARLTRALRPSVLLSTVGVYAERLQTRSSRAASFRAAPRPTQAVLDLAVGMLGRCLLAAAVLTAAILGARSLPPPLAAPLRGALPSLTAATARLPWTVAAVLLAGLTLASLGLIAMERAPRGRSERLDVDDEVA
jgi:hypothetical protein